MTSAPEELQEMYRQQVLEHSRHPHNCHHPEHADRQALGFNPLCGDKLTVYLQLDAELISGAAFEGTGCAISIASASMMSDALQGRSIAKAQALITEVQKMLSNGEPLQDDALKEIEALSGVRNYPSRIKCATLAWTTAEAALHGETGQVSTEK